MSSRAVAISALAIAAHGGLLLAAGCNRDSVIAIGTEDGAGSPVTAATTTATATTGATNEEIDPPDLVFPDCNLPDVDPPDRGLSPVDFALDDAGRAMVVANRWTESMGFRAVVVRISPDGAREYAGEYALETESVPPDAGCDGKRVREWPIAVDTHGSVITNGSYWSDYPCGFRPDYEWVRRYSPQGDARWTFTQPGLRDVREVTFLGDDVSFASLSHARALFRALDPGGNEMWLAERPDIKVWTDDNDHIHGFVGFAARAGGSLAAVYPGPKDTELDLTVSEIRPGGAVGWSHDYDFGESTGEPGTSVVYAYVCPGTEDTVVIFGRASPRGEQTSLWARRVRVEDGAVLWHRTLWKERDTLGAWLHRVDGTVKPDGSTVVVARFHQSSEHPDGDAAALFGIDPYGRVTHRQVLYGCRPWSWRGRPRVHSDAEGSIWVLAAYDDTFWLAKYAPTHELVWEYVHAD